jgi:hypothetical protein
MWAEPESNTPTKRGNSGGILPRDAQSDALPSDLQYLAGVWEKLPELTRQCILAVAKQSLNPSEKG